MNIVVQPIGRSLRKKYICNNHLGKGKNMKIISLNKSFTLLRPFLDHSCNTVSNTEGVNNEWRRGECLF